MKNMQTAPFSKTSRFNSIQAILSIILLLMTTAIFAGFMLVYYETTRTEMDRDLNDLTYFFANHLSTSLIKPLWDMDHVAIKGITEATMKEKQVYAILVTDNLGNSYNKTRDEQWRFTDTREVVFNGEYVRIKKQVIKDEILGTVEVCLTPKFMRKKLRDAIIKMLITLVILNSLLFLTLFFSIRKIIISPIKDTASSLSRISRGDIPDRINEKYKGEFNEIRDSMNMLIEATD
ncbi:MAG: methyl-accepting chemotaxis protein, partial [Desulfobacterales bacterium]|nr:methyl-accepting chemotaxis protein [Desulfobacterales bacterium]